MQFPAICRMILAKSRSMPSIILLTLLGVMVAARAVLPLGKPTTARVNPSGDTATSPQQSEVRPDKPFDLEVIQVALYPQGFDPQEVTVPHKKFLLIVQNRSGIPNPVLRFNGGFEKLSKGKPKSPPRQRHFGGLVNLPPGRYQITEANHPNWVCELTITP
jgi:hypothetical protein